MNLKKKALYSRIFLTKRPKFTNPAEEKIWKITKKFHLPLVNVKHYFVYDVEYYKKSSLYQLKKNILSDRVYEVIDPTTLNLNSKTNYFVLVKLENKFNVVDNSIIKCLKLLSKDAKVKIKHYDMYVLSFSKNQEKNLQIIKDKFVNKFSIKLKNLNTNIADTFLPAQKKSFNLNIPKLTDFEQWKEEKKTQNLYIKEDHLKILFTYFKSNKRFLNYLELIFIDTFWSDHCRHTTFNTKIKDIEVDKNLKQKNDNLLKEVDFYLSELKRIKAYLVNTFTKNKNYSSNKIKKLINNLNLESFSKDFKYSLSLMDFVVLFKVFLLKNNQLKDVVNLEESNAPSLLVPVKDNKNLVQDWILQIKNETHNYSTEIEPYNGAATCLGGSIRDILVAKSIPYSALRITGGDSPSSTKNAIFDPELLKSKLPSHFITSMAAKGFSNYGNQFGLATSLVKEFIHPNYRAKRFEMGVVLGKVKADKLKHSKLIPGDIIVIINKTGSDGVGAARASSTTKTSSNIVDKIQIGNSILEHKIFRFFKKEHIFEKIKKMNDLGAGGISVGVFELADGIIIDLHKVPVKEKNITPEEILFSESQERVVLGIDPKHLEFFKNEAVKENLVCEKIGRVIEKKKYKIFYKQKKLIDLPSELLHADVFNTINKVTIDNKFLKPLSKVFTFDEHKHHTIKEVLFNTLTSDKLFCQKGLNELFDNTIGATTAAQSYGGKYMLTKSDISLHYIDYPNSKTCSIVSYGFDPDIAMDNPFLSGFYSTVLSLTKLVAAGLYYKKARVVVQEYFENLNNPESWEKAILVMTGIFKAQSDFNIPVIGGKDSVHGAYKSIKVPPTSIVVGLSSIEIEKVVKNLLVSKNSFLYLFKTTVKNDLVDANELKFNFNLLNKLQDQKLVLSSKAVTKGGVIVSLVKMAFGNKIGFDVKLNKEDIFSFYPGFLLVETNKKLDQEVINQNIIFLGKTNTSSNFIVNGEKLNIEKTIKLWTKNTLISNWALVENTLVEDQKVYDNFEKKVLKLNKPTKPFRTTKKVIDKIQILNIIFEGTNCEYDMEKSFSHPKTKVINFFFNSNLKRLKENILAAIKLIEKSDMIVLSGGFSNFDQPNGSGKFIGYFLKQKKIKEAIDKFLKNDGLIIGICNGFQGLIRSGYLPGCCSKSENHILTKNNANRHISTVTKTKLVNLNSPWLYDSSFGIEESSIISHGEGKLVVPEKCLKKLLKNKQIAYIYKNKESYIKDKTFVVNGSYMNIEGLISKSGQIIGKMSHPERLKYSFLNYNIIKDKVSIFENAIKWLVNERKKKKI